CQGNLEEFERPLVNEVVGRKCEGSRVAKPWCLRKAERRVVHQSCILDASEQPLVGVESKPMLPIAGRLATDGLLQVRDLRFEISILQDALVGSVERDAKTAKLGVGQA